MNVDILNTITIIINMKTNVFIADMKIFRGGKADEKTWSCLSNVVFIWIDIA